MNIVLRFNLHSWKFVVLSVTGRHLLLQAGKKVLIKEAYLKTVPPQLETGSTVMWADNLSLITRAFACKPANSFFYQFIVIYAKSMLKPNLLWIHPWLLRHVTQSPLSASLWCYRKSEGSLKSFRYILWGPRMIKWNSPSSSCLNI